MADRIQQRRDTAARWAQYNPVLLEGEVGYVTDDPNQYKIGDGVRSWNNLPLRGYTGTIVQETGSNENAVMSQKATSEAIHGILYDVSANNGGVVFESLSDLLSSSNLSTLIPTSVRHGGMSIRFVQSADNNYVQFRYMATEITGTPNPFLDTTNWSFCGDDVLLNSPDFIEAKIDADGKLLESRKSDGTKVEYCDLEVKGSFINQVLQEQLDSKVDEIEGKSLIDKGFASSQETIENSDLLQVTTDSEDKVLSGRRKNGSYFESVSIDTPVISSKVSESNEYNVNNRINLSNNAKEQLKKDLNISSSSESSFDVANGNLQAFGSYQSELEASPVVDSSADCYVGYSTDKRPNKKNFSRLVVGMNHDDLKASDYIGHRKIYNKYGFTANFNFILSPFSSVEQINSMKENVKKMVDDGNTIGLHAIMSGSYWYVNRLYDVKPDGSSTFAPKLSDLKGSNQDGTGENVYGVTISSSTTVSEAGYLNLPSALASLKVVELTQKNLNSINAYYTHFMSGFGAIGLDLDNNSVSKGNTAWLEYWYNNLIDDSLGYSSTQVTAAEKFAEDYEVPTGASFADYYPDASHLREGKIVFFDDTTNPHYGDSSYQKVGRFKKGLFKGCASCCNFEVMDRCIDIAKAFVKHYFGIDGFRHYNRHGDRFFNKHVIYNDLRYMDTDHHFVYNVRGKLFVSRIGNLVSPADLFLSKGVKSAHDESGSITIDYNIYEDSMNKAPKFFTGQNHTNFLNSIGTTIYGNLTYQQFETFMQGLDNWTEYLYNTGGKSVARNGISLNNFGEIRTAIALINSSIGTGMIPIFSWDTVSADPGKVMAIDLILRYCYLNNIEVVSVAKAKELAYNLSDGALKDNYFPNPTFIQNITRTVGNVNIALPEGWGLIKSQGTPTVTVDNSDSSMVVHAPTQEQIEVYTKIFGLPAGSYNLKMTTIIDSNSYIKVYKALNSTPNTLPPSALIGDIGSSTEYTENTITFIVEKYHRNAEDLTNDLNVICDGYEDNFAYLKIVINCTNGGTVKIKDCSIEKV